MYHIYHLDFEDLYLRILNIHAPLKQKYVRGNDQPFMTKTMRKVIMLRTKLRNSNLRCPTEDNGRLFRVHRNYCVKLLKKTKKCYYENLNINVITDSRKFWKCIKPSFSDKMSTSSNFILYENDKIISNEKEVAEKFKSYFSNIVSGLGIKEVECVNVGNDDISNPILRVINNYSEHPSIIAIKSNCESNVKHSFSTLLLQDILEVVYDIDASKATATQNIPTRIFKENTD